MLNETHGDGDLPMDDDTAREVNASDVVEDGSPQQTMDVWADPGEGGGQEAGRGQELHALAQASHKLERPHRPGESTEDPARGVRGGDLGDTARGSHDPHARQCGSTDGTLGGQTMQFDGSYSPSLDVNLTSHASGRVVQISDRGSGGNSSDAFLPRVLGLAH